MSQSGCRRDPETGRIENGDGLCNPYCLALWEGDRWKAIPGVFLTETDALDALSSLVNSAPHKTILVERCNDLEDYAKVYVPSRGIITYEEYANNR